jgi:hypothetical protein
MSTLRAATSQALPWTALFNLQLKRCRLAVTLVQQARRRPSSRSSQPHNWVPTGERLGHQPSLTLAVVGVSYGFASHAKLVRRSKARSRTLRLH